MQIKITILLLLAVGVIAGSSRAALAHETGELGDVRIEIGFETEPPIEGLPNGISIVAVRAAEDSSMEMPMETMDMGDASKLELHGEVFGSGTIETGASFRYEVTNEFEGMTIPFHNHLNHDAFGEIQVTQDAPEAESVTIEIGANGFYDPSTVMVRPGAFVIFTNTDETPQTAISGPPSSNPDFAEDTEAGFVPVIGLEGDLRIEITHTESGTTKELELKPVFGRPGKYLAPLIPTATGQYSVRLFGTIGETDVDATFVSGPGTFDDVVPATSLQFPNEIPSGRELISAARGAQEQVGAAFDAADAADSSAGTALIIGIIGLVAGLAGLSAGGYAVYTSRRSIP
jgi:plastocyanin